MVEAVGAQALSIAVRRHLRDNRHVKDFADVVTELFDDGVLQVLDSLACIVVFALQYLVFLLDFDEFLFSVVQVDTDLIQILGFSLRVIADKQFTVLPA